MMTWKGEKIRLSTSLTPVTNLDRPRIYNAAADAVLLASRECESTARKWDALVDSGVNLYQRSINRQGWSRVRKTTTALKITWFVNLKHPKKMQLVLVGQKQMTIDGMPSTRNCHSSSKTPWRVLSTLSWKLLPELRIHFVWIDSDRQTKRREELCKQQIEDREIKDVLE